MITNICSILLNDSDTERQIIFYVPEENAIYSTYDHNPINTPPLHNLGEAVRACGDLWSAPCWDLQWDPNLEEEEIIMTYEEFRKNVVTLLALDNRAIMFTILEMDGTYVGPGMVDSTNDLYDFDPFIEAALDRCDEETLYVESVVSYVVGDGEVNRAEYGDIDFIVRCMDKYPDFTDKFIREECDELCGYEDVNVENPEYEDPDCDYDEDDE